MRDQCTLNLPDYFIDGNLISGGPLYSNTLSILIWSVFTNTHIPINTHTNICSISRHIRVCGLKSLGWQVPGAQGWVYRPLESWRVAPLHEVQLFFRHAWGPAKISLMGRDRHLRALQPQDLWMSDAYTAPKSLTWHTSGCQCLTVMRTQINNNINTHTGLYRWCCVFAVHMHWTCFLVRIREKSVWIWIPAFFHPFSQKRVTLYFKVIVNSCYMYLLL